MSVRIPIDPPPVPHVYVYERVVIVPTSGAQPWHISPKSVAGVAGFDSQTMWFRRIHVWGADIPPTESATFNSWPVVLTHSSTGYQVEDAGTTGSRRAAVGMQVPPYLGGPHESSDTTDVFTISSQGPVVVHVVATFVTTHSTAGSVML